MSPTGLSWLPDPPPPTVRCYWEHIWRLFGAVVHRGVWLCLAAASSVPVNDDKMTETPSGPESPPAPAVFMRRNLSFAQGFPRFFNCVLVLNAHLSDPIAMLTLLDLPSDVLLLVISTFLDVSDIHLMRQTCREVEQLTRDKSIWFARLEDLRNRGNIPLPPAASDLTTSVGLSSSALESIVVRASITGLNIFLDIWLLIVCDGLVYLWDIRPRRPRKGYCDTLDLRGPGLRWSSYAASLAPGNEQILLAMSSGMAIGSLKKTALYSINIGTSDFTGTGTFNLVRTFDSPNPRTVVALDPNRCLIVLSSSTGTLDIVGWGHRTDNGHISLDEDDTEDLYNGVVALRFLGSHFLAIRTHTIELHLCDGEALQPASDVQPLRHRLPHPLREGAVSISDVLFTVISGLSTRMKLNALAYDGHTLSCYAITIDIPRTTVDSPPAMDVTLVGEMRPPRVQLQSLTRSSSFVSAHALGRQGIRAMWIQRDNLTLTRHVRLCTLNRNATWHEMDTAVNAFLLPSYDLREDLTHCALGEISGHVALANRSGQVFLLPAATTS
ncbi:hypothetical protein B0H16DRAFT_1853488 [Mycena metata]|uniref:F-box domain-containing protein n=1 Tax=Mycena metata TaxID=1033252 RepID=A0AAD7K7B0_9AGAR|nr:hypothetical protein B0H16DRAFT_1853488 [Mycena metata]